MSSTDYPECVFVRFSAYSAMGADISSVTACAALFMGKTSEEVGRCVCVGGGGGGGGGAGGGRMVMVGKDEGLINF